MTKPKFPPNPNHGDYFVNDDGETWQWSRDIGWNDPFIFFCWHRIDGYH